MTRLTYDDWAAALRNDNCAVMRDDGRWESENCDEKHKFICEYDILVKH